MAHRRNQHPPEDVIARLASVLSANTTNSRGPDGTVPSAKTLPEELRDVRLHCAGCSSCGDRLGAHRRWVTAARSAPVPNAPQTSRFVAAVRTAYDDVSRETARGIAATLAVSPWRTPRTLLSAAVGSTLLFVGGSLLADTATTYVESRGGEEHLATTVQSASEVVGAVQAPSADSVAVERVILSTSEAAVAEVASQPDVRQQHTNASPDPALVFDRRYQNVAVGMSLNALAEQPATSVRTNPTVTLHTNSWAMNSPFGYVRSWHIDHDTLADPPTDRSGTFGADDAPRHPAYGVGAHHDEARPPLQMTGSPECPSKLDRGSPDPISTGELMQAAETPLNASLPTTAVDAAPAHC